MRLRGRARREAIYGNEEEPRRSERAGLYLFLLFALALPLLIIGAFVLSSSTIPGEDEGSRCLLYTSDAADE